MLKRVLVFVLFLFIFAYPARAIYEPLSVPNNKFGIHILEPSELEKASELVGIWGYVTIPIRANDRDLEKWSKFMSDCRRFKLIPIMRIASFPVGDHWMAPNEYDLVDFANFLNELSWPTKNRYVVVYNEPNHEGEWGGFVYPEEYARVLDRAIDIFHQRNSDFFVIAAGMDASAANLSESMSSSEYERIMDKTIPGIFEKVDGLAYHAYGNPAFSTYPNTYSKVNILSYKYEFSYDSKKPIFITEAGWKYGGWYKTAFEDYWTDENIVAITPFLLSAHAGPFMDFSFTNSDGSFKNFAVEIKNMSKTDGNPQIAEIPKPATIDRPWTGSLPQILKNDWITSWVSGLLNMLTEKN
ncbi:hypothetical protein HY310_01615 [Candidatus Microgenomates bacterium]|nr:hypothetical protein [Candidatus Microgenomates bacterium]